MISNIILIIVIAIVLITNILALYKNNKSGLKLNANELIRRHIVLYSLQFMIFSSIGIGVLIVLLIINFSITKALSLCVCILVFFIAKILYDKHNI